MLPHTNYNTTIQEYIEIIRDITAEAPVARVKEIAERRGVAKSSVSIVLKDLQNLGLIQHQHYGYVNLTEDGKRLGEILSQRHKILETFLHKILGLESDFACAEACRLEHTMSPIALDALLSYIEKLDFDDSEYPDGEK